MSVPSFLSMALSATSEEGRKAGEGQRGSVARSTASEEPLPLGVFIARLLDFLMKDATRSFTASEISSGTDIPLSQFQDEETKQELESNESIKVNKKKVWSGSQPREEPFYQFNAKADVRSKDDIREALRKRTYGYAVTIGTFSKSYPNAKQDIVDMIYAGEIVVIKQLNRSQKEFIDEDILVYRPETEPLLVKLSGKATVDGGVLRTTADLSKEITRNEVLEIGGTKERVDCRRKNGQEGAIAVSLRSIKSGGGWSAGQYRCDFRPDDLPFKNEITSTSIPLMREVEKSEKMSGPLTLKKYGCTFDVRQEFYSLTKEQRRLFDSHEDVRKVLAKKRLMLARVPQDELSDMKRLIPKKRQKIDQKRRVQTLRADISHLPLEEQQEIIKLRQQQAQE